jgi:uncharacterized protein (TIGR02145 family)
MKNVLFTVLLILGSFSHSQTITFGSQVWMTKNLDVDKFRNGDPIPQAKTNEDWKKAGEEGKPAWCYYKNDTVKGIKYGKLYNWYAVNDPRGLAPTGFHIPSDEDWTKLIDYLESDVAVSDMKTTNTTYDYLRFVELCAGSRHGSKGSFKGLDKKGLLWSSTDYGSKSVGAISVLLKNYKLKQKYFYHKSKGFSVRCLQD